MSGVFLLLLLAMGKLRVSTRNSKCRVHHHLVY
jgi:hypothetical protein